MARLGLEQHIVDRGVYDRTVQRFKEAHIVLPTFAELAEPARMPAAVRSALASIDPDAAHPLNLFRVHWYNDATRRAQDTTPGYLTLTKELTGVDAPILVAIGRRFPLITAHKVLAAYACLVPRVVTGQFDPTAHRAIWPSTGNYCRGGVAISRIMGCRGVAVLPEGMSAERFEWLGRWVADPGDIIRTPGTESNVKEIYDECARLDRDPANVIFNQFSEFGNYLAHWLCTGRALEAVFEHAKRTRPDLIAAAFCSATGSAGTLAAGDHLKEKLGAKIVAVEALECPTLLENGFGEHNIQGIGDKHVPFIHNVMNTDFVVAISDRATDGLDVVFNEPAGREYLVTRRGVAPALVESLGQMGFSGICNVLAAIKLAKYLGLGPEQAVITVATDGADMYRTEHAKALARDFPGGFDAVGAAETYGRHLLGIGTDALLELTLPEKRRVFNLGYYTWVEQQGVSVADFNARREQSYWRGLRDLVPAWDAMIRDFNARTGASPAA